MSIAPVCLETTIPQKAGTETTSVIAARVDAKPTLPSPSENENDRKSNDPIMDNEENNEVKVISSGSDNAIDSSVVVSTAVQDGIFKKEPISHKNHNNDVNLDDTDATYHSEEETENHNDNFNCSKTTPDLPEDSEEEADVEKDIEQHSPIIHVQNKYKCSDGLISNDHNNVSIQNNASIPKVKESTDLKNVDVEKISILQTHPDERGDILCDEIRSTNSCNENHVVQKTTDDLCEDDLNDECFLNPPRPQSPQSQLRDLCKRGDAVLLEKFLEGICDEEEVQQPIDNQNSGIHRIYSIRKIDKSKVI